VLRLQRVKRERDKVRVNELLEQLKAVARDESANIMPITIELVFGLWISI
jgi:methylmalonyl-CoA mutase N-terminal domain/subunit